MLRTAKAWSFNFNFNFRKGKKMVANVLIKSQLQDLLDDVDLQLIFAETDDLIENLEEISIKIKAIIYDI